MKREEAALKICLPGLDEESYLAFVVNRGEIHGVFFPVRKSMAGLGKERGFKIQLNVFFSTNAMI